MGRHFKWPQAHSCGESLPVIDLRCDLVSPFLLFMTIFLGVFGRLGSLPAAGGRQVLCGGCVPKGRLPKRAAVAAFKLQLMIM